MRRKQEAYFDCEYIEHDVHRMTFRRIEIQPIFKHPFLYFCKAFLRFNSVDFAFYGSASFCIVRIGWCRQANFIQKVIGEDQEEERT